MNTRAWQRIIADAAASSDPAQLDSLAKHLAACEEANTILRSKGYGSQGQMINDVARQVPHARDYS